MKALKRTPLSQAIMGVLMLSLSPALLAAETDQADTKKKTDTKADAHVLPEVSVTDQSDKEEPTIVEKYKLPVTVESVTKKELEEKINVFNTEDAIKYEPSILVRKRYIGDNNAPVGTRTTTTSQSARTLIFADGILLSTLLNSNNGNTGSPRWNSVAPNEIDRIDMMYGPFSAAYAGNSLGGVINIITKMPKKFEAYADAQASWQDYSHYGNKGTYETQNYAAGVGDRVNDFSFRFDYNHLDSISQPVGYAASTTSRTGAYTDFSNYGVRQYIYGETQLYHTVQDNFKWKFAYDISPTLKSAYTFGWWENNQYGGVNSFLKDSSGNQTYANFPNFPSLQKSTTYSHGMNLHSETGGKFDWELIGSVVDLANDTNNSASSINPDGSASSLGTSTVLTGTNWHTVDAKGIWRPGDFYGNHEVSFGFHHDLYQLVNPVYKTSNWQGDESNFYPLAAANAGSANSQGKTQTEAYWLQDSWDFAKQWNFTAGGRLESWHAYDGVNSAIQNTYQTINQAEKNSLNFSPKGKLTWSPTDQWKFGAAIAQAYRYPTVGEMYQVYKNASTNQIVSGNPNLKPEKALSSEISAEYFVNKGKFRLSFFQEQVEDAIYSTMSSVVNSNGSISYASVVNNVGQTDTYGIEFSGDKSDVYFDGLDLFGNVTWADARITDNSASDAALAALRASSSASTVNGNLATNPGYYDASTSKLLPRIPEWRATFGATYRVNDQFSATVNSRYSGATFSQLNNSDYNHNQWLGNGSYFVVDTKLNYKITKQFTLSGGIDNINNANYFIFHPFPQRTYMAQLKFNY